MQVGRAICWVIQAAGVLTMNRVAARWRSWCTASALALLSACAGPGGTMAVVGVGNVTRNNAPTMGASVVSVAIPKHVAAPGGSSLSSIAPLVLRVLPFNDDRKDIDTEGTRTAAFGVPMGRIRFEPGPATLLGQATASELTMAGLTLTESASAAQIAGSVLSFEVRTETTLLYWDVIGELSMSLRVTAAGAATTTDLLVYRARCTERTYVWPSDTVVATVMGKCIKDVAASLRSDGRVAAALRQAVAGR